MNIGFRPNKEKYIVFACPGNNAIFVKYLDELKKVYLIPVDPSYPKGTIHNIIPIVNDISDRIKNYLLNVQERYQIPTHIVLSSLSLLKYSADISSKEGLDHIKIRDDYEGIPILMRRGEHVEVQVLEEVSPNNLFYF